MNWRKRSLSSGRERRHGGLPGTVAISADVLHEGPAPVVSDDEWRRGRAEHLASRGSGAVDAIRSQVARWDSSVDAGANEDEVVLWFEHDLFDQLLLIRLLVRIADWPRRPRVTMIATDRSGAVAASRARGAVSEPH